LCLIVGIGYLLLIPVNISASLMINNQSVAQVNNAVSQQKQPLDTMKEKLNQAQSDEDIIKLVQDPKNKQPVKITNPQEVKKQAIANITKAEEQINQQSVAQKQQQTKNLLKNAIKYVLGSLVCGVFFI
jgi:cell division protein YceG involved in septum cleavage